jgi:hypothetical protein
MCRDTLGVSETLLKELEMEDFVTFFGLIIQGNGLVN